VNKVPPQSANLKRRLLAALFLGVVAGTAAAVLDLLQARQSLQHVAEYLLLFLQAFGRSTAAGAVLAAMAVLATWVGERFAERSLGDRAATLRHTFSALAVTLMVTPGAIFVAYRLFQGGLTSRLPARTLLMVAAAFVLIALSFGVIWIVLWRIRRSDQKRGISLSCLFYGGVLIGVAAIAHFVDGHFYRRLYLYLHGVLCVWTLAGFAGAVRIWLGRRLFSPAFAKVQLWGLVVSVIAFGSALATFDHRQTVKVAAFEHTATTANLLQLFYSATSKSRRGKPSAEIVALRRARAAKARTAASGEFPTFPGAHILLISVDALRADRLGVLGYTKRDLTPNIDEWVKQEAVSFERAYCSAPHSSFSITGINISRYPHDETRLNREMTYPTIAEILEENGYDTVALYTQGIFFTEGERVAHYRRSKFGFNKVFGGAPPPDELTDRTIAEIDKAVLNGEPPLFIWVHYFNVHEPYQRTTFGTSPADRYDGEIAAMDPEVVRLIEHAEAVLKKGVVIGFTADHGEEFEDHGGYYHGSTLYDEQVRVPLFIRIPDGKPRRITSQVSNVSLAPTLLRLVGVPPTPSMMGQDLRPAIFGGDEAHVKEPVFASVVNSHMAIQWPWKLIADPAIQWFQLYNLANDPKEQFNVYDRNKAIGQSLLGEIEGFLDELGKGENEARTVLNLGHMRDPRAVQGLMLLLANTGAPIADRVEAADLLGQIGEESAVPVLERTLEDKSDAVALTAALALGSFGNLSGEELLHEALFDPDPAIRDKAALVLGEHGDRAATAQLVEALGRDEVRIRERAIRTLGVLKDPTAVEPLIDALAELRSRYLTVHALGRIQDPRAFEPLMKVLEEDKRTDVRGYTVVALGYLGNQAAIPALLKVLADEPEIKWTPESLVRLGAVGEAPLFGTDVAQGMPALKSGWGRCREKPELQRGGYLDRTTCRTNGSRAEIVFDADVEERATVIVRARHLMNSSAKTALLDVRLNNTSIGQVSLIQSFQEFRLAASAESFKKIPEHNHITLKLEKSSPFEVDHVLVLSLDD
jgi:HEAT repeat protein/arylsulfatase A-like enzyme